MTVEILQSNERGRLLIKSNRHITLSSLFPEMYTSSVGGEIGFRPKVYESVLYTFNVLSSSPLVTTHRPPLRSLSRRPHSCPMSPRIPTCLVEDNYDSVYYFVSAVALVGEYPRLRRVRPSGPHLSPYPWEVSSLLSGTDSSWSSRPSPPLPSHKLVCRKSRILTVGIPKDPQPLVFALFIHPRLLLPSHLPFPVSVRPLRIFRPYTSSLPPPPRRGSRRSVTQGTHSGRDRPPR